MATRHRILIVTKWAFIGGRYVPDILADVPSITDVTQQMNVPVTPNIYVAEVEGLTPPQLATLKAHARVEVIREQTYDDVTGRVSADNSEDTMDTGQITGLKTLIRGKFLDVADSDLDVRGNNRGKIVENMINKLRNLPKGS